MTRVLIAAATPALRAGLRALLDAPAVEVVGAAASLSGLAAALADADVVVVGDAQLLKEGLPAAVGAQGPALVVLSEDGGPAATLRTMSLRGWGIVPPEATIEELQATVVAAAQGLVVLPGRLAGRLLAPPPPGATSDLAPPEEPLTAREREVLELLGQGLSNKLIGRRLQISEHTVKFHVSAVYAKLGAASRTDAVSRGARLGLITL